MPTTFHVISLGNVADIDTIEGDNIAENASALVGLTFGGLGNSLVNNFQTFSPGTTGFGGGTTTAYDMNNTNSNEAFSIDGGPDQIFDGTSIYNATITYSDGSTASVTAVIFQDTAGNTYMAPEFSANADMTALEAGPIRSITLDSLSGNSYSGLTGSRQDWDFVTCFSEGCAILTQNGEVAVEDLRAGDLVLTRDNGFCPIRWIGQAQRIALGSSRPVRIQAGALGLGLPSRDLVVSQQHRMLICSPIARRVFGEQEILVSAKKLVSQPGIEFVDDMITVNYFHLLLDRHEVIFAEGAPTESLLTGPMALVAIGEDAMAEIQEFFPDFVRSAAEPARFLPKGQRIAKMLSRHTRNGKALLSN